MRNGGVSGFERESNAMSACEETRCKVVAWPATCGVRGGERA